jgi:AcrR family transcriptional regulator
VRKSKSAVTKERILRAALASFRKKGFDRTTMRDVAKAAGTSLGAAYYYFPSKEAFVLAHWEQQMDEHEARARAAFATAREPSERIRAVFDVRLELMKNDRKLLGGLFRTIGDTESPVSVFAAETAGLRARGIGLLSEALATAEVPDEVRQQAALALWVVMLGVVLYFVHDDSPGQAATAKLARDAVDLLGPMLPLFASPLAAPLRQRVLEILGDAGLWPTAPVGEPVRSA